MLMYFSVFSPKQVNCFSNTYAKHFMIKWYSKLDPLLEAIETLLNIYTIF